MNSTLSLKDLKEAMASLEPKTPYPTKLLVSSWGWKKLERLVMPTYNNRGYLTGIPIQVVSDSERDFFINEVKIFYSDDTTQVIKI